MAALSGAPSSRQGSNIGEIALGTKDVVANDVGRIAEASMGLELVIPSRLPRPITLANLTAPDPVFSA